MSDLDRIQDKIGYVFRNPSLLRTALTHPSLVHEAGGSGLTDNQRLEFLGDAVLQLVLTEELYRLFPNEPEGRLTKLRSHLANRHSLYHHALALELGEHLALGKGEESTGGRRRLSNLADAFEAVIGAIYLDSGLEPVRQFLWRQFADEFKLLKVKPNAENPKGQLQEILQARSSHSPVYHIASSTGPDHNRRFEAVVTWEGVELGRGWGPSKKEAEKRAATAALAVLEQKLVGCEAKKKKQQAPSSPGKATEAGDTAP